MSEESDIDLPGETADGESLGESRLTPVELPDGDLPASDVTPVGTSSASDSLLTAVLQRGQLEIQLLSPSNTHTDFLSHFDFHAMVVKDREVGPLLDAFAKATAEVWEEDSSRRSATNTADGASEAFTALLERMTSRWPDARVLITPKKGISQQVDAQFNEWTKRILARLELSDADRKLISDAGQIHSVIRFRQTDPAATASKTSLTSYARLLTSLQEEPALIGVLKRIFTRSALGTANPGPRDIGAQALTLLDLFCDRFAPDHSLNRKLVDTVAKELRSLQGSLFTKPVVDGFLAMLEEDLPAFEADDQKNRILVYTDLLDHIFPLEARLRHEGFQAFITDSLEMCPQINRRKHPSIIILRLRAQPSIVIKAIHYLLSHGVGLTETPTFLLVDAQHVDRLTSLLALGIEDILDLNGRLDSVILKIKKVRSRLKNTARTTLAESAPASGTSGHLSDMNLIDLLQALGPSQRTARVTLNPPESTEPALSVILSKGSIVFAQLGELVGQAAIHRAMSWNQGNWLVEQITEADLPTPNNTLSNEAILIEGCRLLDESSRQAEAPAPS